MDATAVLRHGIKAYTSLNENGKERFCPDTLLEIYGMILIALSRLTPRQLMQAFPISGMASKEKGADRDWNSTMVMLARYGYDKTMGNNSETIFWGYCNEEIISFQVGLFSAFCEIYKNDNTRDLQMDFYGSETSFIENFEWFTNPLIGVTQKNEIHVDETVLKQQKPPSAMFIAYVFRMLYSNQSNLLFRIASAG